MSDLTNAGKLRQLHVATPCQAEWNAMSGDESVRFCEHCQKHVHNLSELSPAEISDLVGRPTGICARIYKRPDGSVVTAGSGSQISIARRTFTRAIAAGLSSALFPIFAQRPASESSKEQNLVRGIVKDQTFAPIPEAEVRLHQKGKLVFGLFSDKMGKFTIAGVASGEYELVVECKGFLPARTKVRLRANSTVDLDIMLKIGSFDTGIVVEAALPNIR